MSLIPFNTLHGALKQLWYERLGVRNTGVPSLSPGVSISGSNRLRTGRVDIARVGLDDRLQLNGGPTPQPVYWPLTCHLVPNAEMVDTCFHIFNQPSVITSGQPIGRIIAIEEIHATAGNHASAVTANVTKEKNGQAPGSGTTVMSGTFDMKGTANTRQTATLSSDPAALEFTGGDRLSLNFTGNTQTLAGVNVTVWVQYYTTMAEISFYRPGVDGNDQAFFLANRPYTVWGISYAHKTAEATAATMWVQVDKATGTQAPGAGTNLLTNNTDNGFGGKATLNTVQTGSLVTTAGVTTLAAGDRLTVDYAGSPTEHAGVCITVAFTPEAGRIEANYFRRDTDATDTCILQANRDFQLWDGRQVHAVAAGGASTAQLVKDTGTDAPGAGTNLLATAWDLNATANTVQVLDPVTVKATQLLVAGNRLAIDYADAEQSLIGVVQTISLLAR